MKSTVPRILAVVIVLAVFGISVGAQAQTESVIYNFPGGNNGSAPVFGLTFHDGNIFGMTAGGGAYGQSGTLFELSPNGNGSWTENVLHAFDASTDGSVPEGPLLFDAAGNFYGIASANGLNECGLVFEFSPVGASWQMNDLYDFACGSDGAFPVGGLAMDAAGNLYGATQYGGDVSSKTCYIAPWAEGCGVIFTLTPGSNGVWTEKVLYTFTAGADGFWPLGGPVIDSFGHLFGASAYGGKYSRSGFGGVVFELSQSKTGSWKYSSLHAFQGTDGNLPLGNFILNSSGNLYGTTWQGGALQDCNGLGCGVVFEVSPSSSGWRTSVLRTFKGSTDGGSLYAPLVLIGGKLAGVAQIGGNLSECQGAGCGVVYELLPPGKSGIQWNEKVLYSFTGGNDGNGPLGRLTFDGSGNLYGETRIGGTDNLGVVFEITH